MSSYQNSIPITIHAEIDNDIIIDEEISQRSGGVTTGRRIFRSVFGSAFGIGCCCMGALLLLAYLGSSPIDNNQVSSLRLNNNMQELAQQQMLPVDMLEETPVHHRAPVHHRKDDDDDKDDAEDDAEDDEPEDEPEEDVSDEPAPVHKHHNHTHAEADENENGIPDKKENEFWETIEKDIHDFFHHPASTETAAIEAAAFENEFGYD